jgi:hypothetical protein
MSNELDKDPREFSCMDDSPFNNGWGYNYPEPREEEPEDENNFDNENEIYAEDD